MKLTLKAYHKSLFPPYTNGYPAKVMTKPYYLMPDDENYISKTDLKKEAKELQDFASQLCALSKKQQETLTASEELYAAFALANKIKSKPDAFRRHMQFMAKVLQDEELEKLQDEYFKLSNPQIEAEKQSKILEKLRSDIIEQGDTKINALLNDYPTLDRQKLRQLTRQAKKEVTAEKPGKSYKELFQYLKEATEEE